MTNAPEPLDPSFQLHLPAFEGPLDLLLHLVQKHDLEILDLPVAFVTERYLEYLGLMHEMNLDIAAEYLVMAATLAYIKSKMLLPPDPTAVDDAEAEEEIDPRAELIRRLLEYQKYKQAAEDLAGRGMTGRDVFLRGMEAPEALGDAPLAGFGLFKLLDAFKAVLERNNKASSFAVTHEGIGIHDRMRQLVDKLALKRRCSFEELFEDAATTYDLVVTFLAILEMAKRRLARIYQSEPIAPIHLEYTVITEDAAEEALAAPTTADGGGEDAEAKLDEAVARAGEDPLGPARDVEEEEPLDDEDARADAELEEALARAAEEPADAPPDAETTPVTNVAHDEAEAEAMREEALGGAAMDDSFAPAETAGAPSGAVLDSEQDVAHSGDPATADPNASDDE